MPTGKANDAGLVKCEFCYELYGSTEPRTIKSLNQHIRRTPSHPSIEDYIKRYGEFRNSPKATYDHLNSEFKCLVCGEGFHSHNRLAYHIRIDHNMNFIENYVKKLVFKEVPQLCKCGCGEEVILLKQPPYRRDYKSGHNNDHVGRIRSFESRMKMRKSAIKRVKERKGVIFYNGISKAEKELLSWLKSNYHGEVVENDKEILSGLELDIYLPELKIAIEFNGEKYHSGDKTYHLKKTEECNRQGIHLIHIWYGNWYRKKEICKSIIASQVGLLENKVYARHTKVVEITPQESSKFLTKNHLQEGHNSKIRLGLKNDQGELVAVMTFGSLNRGISKAKRVESPDSYELIRFCSKVNLQVVGGASKLFKFFLEKYKPNYIKSYANRDWAKGGVYLALGFTFSRFTKPNYFYHKSKIHYHRSAFQKHILVKAGYDPSKTEIQIMEERGFNKIYGTGNFVFEWKSN